MFESLKLAVRLAREAIAEGKLREVFRQQVFQNRIITPVEMDLLLLDSQKDPLEGTGCALVELNLADIQAGTITFAVPSRKAKAFRNLKRGMRGFALVKDSIVVGDLWCVAPLDKKKQVVHSDLTMLKIKCAEGDAYAQDMLIDPQYRGKNLAVPLQRALQLTLKKEGWKKVYGAYYDDNIPAMWMHKMLKFKELPKLRVSRFFSYIKSEKIAPSGGR